MLVCAMKTTSLLPRPFTVTAVDPTAYAHAHAGTAGHVRYMVIEVRAVSTDEARRLARAELAKDRRDDWSVARVRAA